MPVRSTLAALVLASLAIWSLASQPASNNEQQLAKFRNLGKAFYENPTTQLESVTEFKKALALAPNSIREKLNLGLAYLRAANNPEGLKYLEDVQRLDPKLPHTWFNLGIHWKKQGDADKAIAQFRQFARLAPTEPKAHYNLGAALKLGGHNEEAVKSFEQAAKLDGTLAAARFQLYNGYRVLGKAAEAQAALKEFQRLKKEQEGAAIPEDVDWCDYAEIYDPVPNVTDTPANPKYAYRELGAGATFALAFDAFGEAKPSLAIGHKDKIAIWRQGTIPATPINIAGAINAAAGDYNNDLSTDLVVLTETAGPKLFKNTRGAFTPVNVTWPTGKFRKALWLDYDHDYDLDLFLFGDRSALLRNAGAAGFEEKPFPFRPGAVDDAVTTRINPDSRAFDLRVDLAGGKRVLYRDRLAGTYEATDELRTGPALTNTKIAEADFNLDGRLDRAEIDDTGKARLALDTNPQSPRWIRVALSGVRNLKNAQDAFVEIKAGTLYKRARYEGFPLLFTAGNANEVDVVRITWPNGLIQNETKQPTNRAYAYKEAQRLSGSCPIIWTYDGEGFQYITDVLGVAPLGATDGEGTVATNNVEYVQIPGSKLKAAGGHYDIRVTEELSEAAFIDNIQLIALDHPTNTNVHTNEKWKAPPFPEYRLFTTNQRQDPIKATDHNGQDVRAALAKQDKTYPTGFQRNMSGVAELHNLTLDFGHQNGNILVMHGWVDWADGSTFLQVAQEKQGGLQTPRLQMKNAKGEWQTIIEDMGMPAGKPKTIVVDLTGKWLSASRELRIVTNMCVYWDEIFLSTSTNETIRQTAQQPTKAHLHFRGFSPSVIHPERSQPEQFSYANPEPTTLWNPTPGLYTKYGEVAELLHKADDHLVIMGSGDEIRLTFDAAKFPPLQKGHTRSFLLKVEGWAKDRDANTLEGHRVQPIPFRSMQQYPPAPAEHHPHPEYEKAWNTRPALVLLRSLR